MKIKTRIFLAFIIGLLLVAGAFWWKPVEAPSVQTEVSLNLEGPGRTFLRVTDTNQDGLPDWKEALAVGEVVSLDGISSTTPYNPNTATGKALITLTERYLEAKSRGTGTVSETEVLSEASRDLLAQGQDEPYVANDLNLSANTDTLALKSYGNAIVKAIIDHPLPPNTRNELEVLAEALEKDDQTILEELDPIIAAYEDILGTMLVMPVPENMVIEHLALANVYRALLEDIKAFRGVFTDAAPSMIRTRRYPADNIALYTAITNLYEKLDGLGIKWSSEDIASTLIKVE